MHDDPRQAIWQVECAANSYPEYMEHIDGRPGQVECAANSSPQASNAPQTPAHKHQMRRKLQPTSIECAANSCQQALNAPQTPPQVPNAPQTPPQVPNAPQTPARLRQAMYSICFVFLK